MKTEVKLCDGIQRNSRQPQQQLGQTAATTMKKGDKKKRKGSKRKRENWDKSYDKIRWKLRERENQKTGKAKRTQSSLDGFVSKKGGIIVAWNGQM